MARCPAHDDKTASLSISEGSDRKVLLHCHAGCIAESVCTACGLRFADLFPARADSKREIVATYDYRDAEAKLLFQVVRFSPKDFRQRRPDPNASDGWAWNTKLIKRVLFRLPETLAAVAAGRNIIVAEGEKDVLALVEQGFSATCNPGGAGKWAAGYSETLRGANVLIVADKDGAGRQHAQEVASALSGIASRVRVIELPDVGGKKVKDAHDFFAAGGTADSFKEIAKSATDWKATESVVTATGTGFSEVTAWVRGEILRVARDRDMAHNQKQNRVAQVVDEALPKIGRFYYHAEFRDFETAMFFNSHRKVLERVRGDAFAAWLSEWLVINRADPLFRFALSAVETTALSPERSKGIVPEKFWAARSSALYMSNGDGRVVRITAMGVESVDNGTDDVLFAAGRTLAPWVLTNPQDPFAACTIFKSMHAEDEHGPIIFRLWFYSFVRNFPNKPPLCLAGDVGSGKTRSARAIAELLGLPFIGQKVEEKSEEQFWPCMDQGGLLVLDNADTKTRWLADAVANASTGGCCQRRRLYSNAETVILRPRAWLCITTANPSFASDSGLADRLLVVRMSPRGEGTSDSRLSDEIAATRDGCLSHIAQTLRIALADARPTPEKLNARHPDFASFAVRIGRAIGRESQAVAALRAAEQDKSAFCLENDTIAAALLTFLHREGSFTGTAADLVPHLVEIDSDLEDKLSAKRLGKRLTALWPHLQKATSARKELDRATKVTVFSFQGSSRRSAQAENLEPPMEDAPPEPVEYL